MNTKIYVENPNWEKQLAGMTEKIHYTGQSTRLISKQ